MTTKSYENLRIEDISFRNRKESDPKTSFVKETAAETETINTAENVIREAMILQALEEKGVQNIPRVKRNSKDLPLSESAYVTDPRVKKTTIQTILSKLPIQIPALAVEEKRMHYSNFAMDKIEGKGWERYKFSSQMEQLDSAISAAHTLDSIVKAGFLHNDIKPSNIMVNEKGQTIIIDFNNSKRLNKIGLVDEPTGGTPRYRAPEADGKKDFDVRADIYSFAVTVAEISGVDTSDLAPNKEKPLQFGNRLANFRQKIFESVKQGRISGKMALFIRINTDTDRLERLGSFDEVAEALEIVKDEDKTIEDLDKYIRSKTEK